jgi:hypothetical protein
MRIVTTCSILIIGMASVSAKKRVPIGNWQSTPITIDGNDEDWQSVQLSFDQDAGITYAVTNDSNMLYLMVKPVDESTQMKLLHGGMQVWIDMGGGKDKNSGVYFPLSNTQIGKNMQGLRGNSPGSKHDMKKMRVSQAREYAIVGFRSCEGTYPLLQSNSCNVFVRIGIDKDDNLVWEAAIPISSIYKQHIDTTDTYKAFSVGFEINGLERPDRESEDRQNMPSRGGGPSGGPPPGGFQGGPPIGQMGDMKKISEQTNTWVKTSFAFRK